MVSNIIGQDAGAKGHQAKGHGVTGQNLKIKGQEVKGEISVMKRRWSVQNNRHVSKITGQKWKVKESKVGQVKDYDVIMVVVSKVPGRRSIGWKVSRVESRSGQRSWCHQSWCPTPSVKDAGAKGHQAKGDGVTGQNLEIKGQEVKGEIFVTRRRGSVQNNKHGSNLTGQKWKVRESKVGQIKDYSVIMVVVSKVTCRNSVWWKVSGVKSRSHQNLGVISHGVEHHRSKMLVPRVIKQNVMGSQVRTWKSKARKSKVKYLWSRGVDRSKIINKAQNSQVKIERLGRRGSVRSKTMV